MNKTLNLFLSTFKISASTFGGGFVIVPLLKKRFVDELGWLEEEEVLDLIAIAQSSPGPIAVNASVLIGYKALGVVGMLTAPMVLSMLLAYVGENARNKNRGI